MTANQLIPREIALKLCDEIRAKNEKKWFSFGKLQCWGCYKWAKGDTEKRCLSSEQGCNLVNDRYKWREGSK